MDTIMKHESDIFRQLVPDREPVIDPETEDYMLDEMGEVVMMQTHNSSTIELPSTNMFYDQVQGSSVVIPHDAYEGYDDVTGLDPKLSKSCELYIEYEGGRYQGLTWYTVGRTAGGTNIIAMMGIRVSLANIILGKRGTARKILDAMIAVGKRHNCEYLVVVWPLPSMVPLLNKLNFTESDDPRFSSVTKVMVGSTNHYYLNISD